MSQNKMNGITASQPDGGILDERKLVPPQGLGAASPQNSMTHCNGAAHSHSIVLGGLVEMS